VGHRNGLKDQLVGGKITGPTGMLRSFSLTWGELPLGAHPSSVQMGNVGLLCYERKNEPTMIISRPQTASSFLLAATIVGSCLAVSPAGSAPVAAGELRLGTAAVKITPPSGTPMAGSYSRRGSEGVLDDIHAKAAVLDDGKTVAALVACDLIGLQGSVVIEARRLIAEKTGIPGNNVMISATHTHTAPVLVGDSTLDDMTSGGSQLSRDYAKQLPKWIAQAVERAHAGRTPAQVSYGYENEHKLSYIRRFYMKDGSVAWNPGIGNPNMIRQIGVIDPQVNVVYAETVDKRPILTYVNFAMHLDTTGGAKISADCPAALAARLADYKGPEMLTIFTNGASGNINHINVNWREPQSSPEAAKRLGTILAADVLKAYAELKPAEDVTLRVRREVLQLPLAKFTDDELRKAKEIVARHGDNATFLEQVKAYRVLDVAARQGKPFDVDIQVIALGRDIAWVALPAEAFVELGLSIKAASPFRQTNVVELANGASFYAPHRSAFSEGQFEVVATRYAEGAGELLVTTAIRLLAELHRDAAGRTRL
jgi:neutral ceramidase